MIGRTLVQDTAMESNHLSDEDGGLWVLEETASSPDETTSSSSMMGWWLLGVGTAGLALGGVYWLLRGKSYQSNPSPEFESAARMLGERDQYGHSPYTTTARVKRILAVLNSQDSTERMWAIDQLKSFSSNHEDVIAGRFHQMVRDPSPMVRSMIAEQESTPDEALEELAKDADPKIREAVARNEVTPSEVLQGLASDPEAAVRMAVAMNETTPKPVLAKLSEDLVRDVRLAVTTNPKTETKVLSQMVQYERDPQVKRAAELAWRAGVKESKKPRGMW